MKGRQSGNSSSSAINLTMPTPEQALAVWELLDVLRDRGGTSLIRRN